MSRNEYKGISSRGRELLARGEDRLVDYKLMLKGLHAEDLVAFANSKSGGAILIGVKEVVEDNGQQIGEPVGCKIGDGEKLKVMGKALSCSPPVQIELILENVSSKPFYRIEIPSGSHKPYCTNAGAYKIREDGRNTPLHPEQLLSMFLDREGEEFRARFSQAAGDLEVNMAQTLNTVGELEYAISSKIDQISGSVEGAEFEASSTRRLLERVDTYTRAIHKRSSKLEKRIRSLMQHLEASDPVKEEAKAVLLSEFIAEIEADIGLLEAAKQGRLLPLGLDSEQSAEFDDSEIKEILRLAIQKINKG